MASEKFSNVIFSNADKHSPASSVRSTRASLFYRSGGIHGQRLSGRTNCRCDSHSLRLYLHRCCFYVTFSVIRLNCAKDGVSKITDKKVYYHLPGLFEFYELYRVFLPVFREHREYFYDWCEIGSIYGAPSDCIWGGGRTSFWRCRSAGSAEH